MIYVLGYVVAFLALTFVVLVVVGWLTPDPEWWPPHNSKCDCMRCGRQAAEKNARGLK